MNGALLGGVLGGIFIRGTQDCLEAAPLVVVFDWPALICMVVSPVTLEVDGAVLGGVLSGVSRGSWRTFLVAALLVVDLRLTSQETLLVVLCEGTLDPRLVRPLPLVCMVVGDELWLLYRITYKEVSTNYLFYFVVGNILDSSEIIFIGRRQ